MAAISTVRREFPDTAYWNATVKTGADGKATVELALPDNLTTWTMDARAITAETQVGQTKADVIATKDLLVRPVLPRFFIEGDKAEIAAIVHNNTQDEVKVEVKLRADGLQVGAATTQNVTIKAGDTAKVTWPVTVQTAADQVKVLMSAVENPQSAIGQSANRTPSRSPCPSTATPRRKSSAAAARSGRTRAGWSCSGSRRMPIRRAASWW